MTSLTQDGGWRLASEPDVDAPFMKPGALQINKELQQDDVIDLVDQPRLAVVGCLQLIADIHIELFHELVIHAEKQSVLIESCLRTASDRI